MRMLLLSLALVAAPAFASDLAMHNTQTGASIRLTEGACVDAKTLAEIKDEVAPKFKAASATIDGVNYAGCWLETRGRVVLFFEDR